MNSQTFYHSLRTFSKLPDVCLLIIIHVDEQYAKGHNINPFWMLLTENRMIAVNISNQAELE